MTQDNRPAGPSDADLVAFLDGELTPAESTRLCQTLATDSKLKSRLDHLMAGGRAFRDGFDPLLQAAPTARLEAMLDRAMQRPQPIQRRPILGWAGLAAAAMVTLAIGAGLDRAFVSHNAAPRSMAVAEDESADWRVAVANYLALYTPATLAQVTTTPADQARDVASVGGRLGLALTPAKVALGDLPLKRADLYDYDGKPLAFLAYLDPGQGPVALCIIDGGEPAEARTERRMGMNVVYWSGGGHSFMLIGHASSDSLQKLAATAQARLAGDAERAG